jgi:hypothetical protein
MGSSINGLKNPNHRCYPWTRADAEGTLSQAIHRTDPSLSQEGLFREHPDPDKIDVDFGKLQFRLAQRVGLDEPWGLDISCNACTCGDEYYSMRVAQNAKDDSFISDHDKQILEAEAKHRYGNLAYVYLP